jgi:hypothetical protein
LAQSRVADDHVVAHHAQQVPLPIRHRPLNHLKKLHSAQSVANAQSVPTIVVDATVTAMVAIATLKALTNQHHAQRRTIKVKALTVIHVIPMTIVVAAIGITATVVDVIATTVVIAMTVTTVVIAMIAAVTVTVVAQVNTTLK